MRLQSTLAVLVVMAGSFACGGPRSEKGGATLILYGGSILTLNPDFPTVESLAIADGRIVSMGSKETVMAWRGPATRLVDLEGKTLTASLKDHHLHVLDLGWSLLNKRKNEELFLDLTQAGTVEEIARRITGRAAETPEGTWILGKGWSQGAWGTEELPSHRVLSEAAPKHPVFLTRTDGHCGWANAEALRLAGISESTPDPPGGEFLRGKGNAEPTGILLERANEPLVALIPEPDDEDVMEAFRLALRTLASRGVTEVYDAGFLAFPGVVGLNARFHRYLDLLRRVATEEMLPVRVNLMIPSPSALADEVVAHPRSFLSDRRLRVTHLKLFQDGALGSRGGALRQPYADDPSTRGVHRMTVEELAREVARALDAGLDVATHAIGDGAVGRALDAYESVLASDPEISPRRLRIEHFSHASSEDMERAARLGIVLVVQPGFIYPNDEGRTMEDARLGEERAKNAYAFGRLHRLGARLAGSSDDFAMPPPPLWSFYAAATRKNPSGLPPEGWHKEENLSREESLRLLTRLSPAGGGEPFDGQLRIGGAADCVVWSANLLAVPESEILAVRVYATLLEGEPTFHDGSIAGLE